MKIDKNTAKKILDYITKKAGYVDYKFCYVGHEYMIELVGSRLSSYVYIDNDISTPFTTKELNIVKMIKLLLKKLKDGSDICCFAQIKLPGKNTCFNFYTQQWESDYNMRYSTIIPRHSTLEQILIEADMTNLDFLEV